MMKTTTRTCPHCSMSLKPREIRAAGTFPCPNCHAQLQAPNRYGRWIGLASLLLSIGGSFALGFTGLHLIYAVLLLTLAVDVLLINLFKYALPPKVVTALPPKSFRQIAREHMGPAVLDLGTKERSSRRGGGPDGDQRT